MRVENPKLKHFVIELYNHGSPDSLPFSKPVTAKTLIDIAQAYPSCSFTYSTVACFGGGIRNQFLNELKSHPDLANRIDLIMEAKPESVTHLVNIHGQSSDPSTPNRLRSTLYLNELMIGILDQRVKTYGEAVRSADESTKRLFPQDAEEVINGKLISDGTERFRNYIMGASNSDEPLMSA